MDTLRKKLMNVNHSLMEETIKSAPTHQVIELIMEYDSTLGLIIVETLTTIIKDIKKGKHYEDN